MPTGRVGFKLMTIDVIDLRNFYSRRLGMVARRVISRGIQRVWPHAEGMRVAGIGYPTPYLGLFREDAERCIALMPAAQGVLKWPTARPALSTLVNEFSLPLADAAIDRTAATCINCSSVILLLLSKLIIGGQLVAPRPKVNFSPNVFSSGRFTTVLISLPLGVLLILSLKPH